MCNGYLYLGQRGLGVKVVPKREDTAWRIDLGGRAHRCREGVVGV